MLESIAKEMIAAAKANPFDQRKNKTVHPRCHSFIACDGQLFAASFTLDVVIVNFQTFYVWHLTLQNTEESEFPPELLSKLVETFFPDPLFVSRLAPTLFPKHIVHFSSMASSPNEEYQNENCEQSKVVADLLAGTSVDGQV